MRKCCLALLLVSLLLSLPAAQAQGPGEGLLYSQSFDDGAPGWELEPGWAATGGALCGEGHRWARAEVGSWSDYRVRLHLRLLRGTIHLNYRTSGPRRYFIGLHEHGLYLEKQIGPQEFAGGLASAGAAYALDAWHEVEIAGQGGHLQVSVDGRLALEYTDPEPLPAGGIAFETLDDSAACIDDVSVYGPPPPSSPTPDASFTWVRTGGPLGGLGYDIRLRPDDPQRMYVTDAYAGVHISNDRGLTWAPANQGIAARGGPSGDAIPVFSLTVDPHDHDIIWAGTQDVRGIYRSADGGQTWTEMDDGVVERQGISFRGFTVDPRSSDIVYAAAELSSWAWAGEGRPGREFDMTKGVVYKTTDGGRHWQAVWRGDNLARYVWIDPRDPDTVYVSTGIFDREAANSDPASRRPGGVGVVKSSDGGRTWTEVNNGLGNLYVGSLFMHPEDPDILLAGTGNNQYYEGDGVYLSSDGGATWRQTLSEDIITAVEFSVSQPEVAYAASAVAVYRSIDGGRHWQRVTAGELGWGPPGVRAGFPIDLQVDLEDPDRIYANNYGGGNFLSTDGGRTWAVASDGYTGAQTRDIAVDPSAPGLVYVAARSGIFASADGGKEWAGLSWPPVDSLEWNAVAVDPGAPRHLLASTNWDGWLARSRDGGRSWIHVAQVGEGLGWRAIAFAPSDPATVYAGTGAYYSAGAFDTRFPADGIHVSHDGGATWRPANDSLSQDAHVAGLAVDPRDPQLVYAATANYGILKSADGGQSWQAANGELPSVDASAVTVHPTEPGLLYAGLAHAGLYRSWDGGATWQLASTGLNPESVISDIVFDPTNPDAVYLADVFSGVYRSVDGGASWLPINHGLRTRAVNALAISADGRHVYAATEGEGAFRLDLNGAPPEVAPALVRPAAPAPHPTAAARPTEPPPTAAPVASAAPLPVATSAPAGQASPTPVVGLPGGIARWLGGTAALLLLALAVARHRRRAS